jgi:nucleoside-diphosphate-sugar epimerase
LIRSNSAKEIWVILVSSNCIKSLAGVEKAFATEDGSVWDWAINLAGETKYGLSQEVYEERIYNLSVNVAKQAAKSKVGVFVEVSTAQVYDADKV